MATTTATPTTAAPWQAIAIASGACAAFNGVFAKLTTNDLTASIATSLSKAIKIPLPPSSVEYVLRAVIFALSFFFTGTMWAFYTKALSVAPSAVQANIVNTSANFIITALLGSLIFGEHLPPLWWVGAVLLISGSVIIGRRDKGADKAKDE